MHHWKKTAGDRERKKCRLVPIVCVHVCLCVFKGVCVCVQCWPASVAVFKRVFLRARKCRLKR